MRKISLIAIAGAFSAYGLAATAQEADPTVDTDGDGMYSLEELQAAHPELTEADLTALDTNADGFVDPVEYQTAVDAGIIAASE